MNAEGRNMREYEYEYAEFIYYTPGELDRDGQLWPVRAGRNLAKPHYQVGPKRIECYSLHFVLEGKIGLDFENRRQELQKGDLFCLFPGETYHYDRVSEESPLQMSWLALDGGRVKSLLNLAGVTPEKPFAHGKVTSLVKDVMDRTLGAMARFERWNPAVSLELQGLVCQLMAAMMSVSSSADQASEPSVWIRECMKFMDLHSTEGISVQQVAAFAGVHRSYFSNAFTSQVGVPPQKYIQNIRMEKAKRLLVETDATVTEIALSLGYPTLYTFTRAFTSYYKKSPKYIRSAGGV